VADALASAQLHAAVAGYWHSIDLQDDIIWLQQAYSARHGEHLAHHDACSTAGRRCHHTHLLQLMTLLMH
jgi:hypothetical protein